MPARTLAVVGALAVLCVLPSVAQGPDHPHLSIPRTDVVPRLEDFADMALPRHLEGKLARVPGFVQREPVDGAPPSFATDVYLGYDDKQLHVVFVAFDDQPDRLRANMSPRDNVFDDDQVNIMVDTDNDQRGAYVFITTPLGIQWEGTFTEGPGFDGSFDAVWRSEGRITDRGYIVKMEIPFVGLRFPDTDEQTWRVIFNRSIPRLSEESYWPTYTLAIDGRLNQAATLSGIRDISPGRNIQLVPFVFYRDFRNAAGQVAAPEVVDRGNEEAVGLDAKVVIKDALVLDLTANPDFSQVESDEPQVTVNQRFEVFFPERRPFFLENADVFQTPTNLVFTRRIADPSAGLKLTGKQGPYTVGLLLADDQAPGKNAPAGDPLVGEHAEIGVLRLARDVGGQSRLGILLSDRELADGYNRVGAFDGRIKLNDNWISQFQVAASGTRSPDGQDTFDGMSYNAYVDRVGTHLTTHTHYLYTSPDFVTQLGFLGGGQRPDAQIMHNSVVYKFRPADSKLASWGPSLFVERVLDTDGDGLEWSATPEMTWDWSEGTSLRLGTALHRERLSPQDFPTLAAPRGYSRTRWFVDFDTRRFDRVGFGIAVNGGRAINFVPPAGEAPEPADYLAFAADMLWRPISPLRVNFTYLRTQLDRREGAGRIFTNTIGSARANWQFTKELSLRLIGEYQDTDTVPGATSLASDTFLTGDVLVRYQWNPWRALYAGYTTNQRDIDEPGLVPGSQVQVTDRGRQFFVKFSYLFQL